MEKNTNSVEETKTDETKIEETKTEKSVTQTESTVKTEEPKKGKSNNMILIILLVVILLVGAGLSYYFLIVKQQNSNPNNNGTTTTTSATGNDETTTVVTGDDGTTTTTTSVTTTTTAVKEKNEIEVIDLQGPCINGQDCNKEIKDIKLGGKTLKLSVDFKRFNVEGGGGDIILGDKRINFEKLTRKYQTNYLDGFGVYKDYLIVYASDIAATHAHITDESDCEVHEFSIYILDADLNEVGYLNGESVYGPMDDVKINNNYIYFYALNRTQTTGLTLEYNRILFDKIISGTATVSEFISTVDACKNMY